MSELLSKLAELNPFDRSGSDDSDVGEEIDSNTIAGGGHGARQTDITRHQLGVSHALRSFLVREGVLDEDEAGLDEPDRLTPSLHALLDEPHISVPAHVTDRSRPLPEYFVSSSHNTYLHANQLYGRSSAGIYETVLRAGSRCVEIDAWDNEDQPDEPKVTHGYTLVSRVPFRAVCEAIRTVVDDEQAAAEGSGCLPAPILVSLENHCGPRGQMRLVEILTEVFGDRLLSEEVRRKGHGEQQGTGEHVTLEELGSKVVMIVEYHVPAEADTSSGSGDEEEGSEEERGQRRAYEKAKKSTASNTIIPELAALGVYAQSVKPQDNSWFDPGELRDGPHHHLINVSETALASHLPAHAAAIAAHNTRHLMRVFPRGTRISSRNMQPAPFWAVGAHICALNWQTFGAPVQLNEALFAGSDGYVLKPPHLRGLAPPPPHRQRRPHPRRRLRLRVAGAAGVPLPAGAGAGADADGVRPYLTCSLVGAAGRAKRRTRPYRHHRVGFLHRGENPPPTDPLWDEVLDWGREGYEEDGLAFLRLALKGEVPFGRNPVFAVAAVRLMYVVPGWRFLRMLDLKGRETRCVVLVRFELEDLADGEA